MAIPKRADMEKRIKERYGNIRGADLKAVVLSTYGLDGDQWGGRFIAADSATSNNQSPFDEPRIEDLTPNVLRAILRGSGIKKRSDPI